MFSALRVRGLFSRNELATIITRGEHDYDSLIKLVHAGSPELTNYRRIPFLDLAWIVGNQRIHEQDLYDAEAIYEYVLNYWQGRFQHLYRIDYALLKLRVGQPARAREILRPIPNLIGLISKFYPGHLASIKVQSINEGFNFFLLIRKDWTLSVKFLKTDIANPFRGLSDRDSLETLQTREARLWLKRLHRQLFGRRLARLMFVEEPTIGPLESLTVRLPKNASSGIANEPKVTIVISAFQPDQHIFTAVKSALAQTYRNLEIMVIDDASGPDYEGILAEVAALDERIRVLSQPVNGGTYRIRNRALDEATGDLITFQDSDDWMHPQRVAVQVKHLLKHPNQVGNTTMSTRLTDRLEAAESNRRLRIGVCEPSLMFWRIKVRDQIGYFDSVRKGGDTEFRKRMDKAFHTDSAMVYPWRILTIQRADNGGLTQGELGYRWITEFRLNYRDLYLNWHKTAQKLFIHRDDAAATLAEQEASRAFYAPRQSRMVAAQARGGKRKFDLLIAANLKDPKNAKAAVARAEQAVGAGKTVGFAQVNAFYPRQLSRVLHKDVLAFLNDRKAEMVYWRDEVTAERLEFLAPNAWLTSQDGQELVWKINDFSAVDHELAAESFIGKGPKVRGAIEASLKATFSN